MQTEQSIGIEKRRRTEAIRSTSGIILHLSTADRRRKRLLHVEQAFGLHRDHLPTAWRASFSLSHMSSIISVSGMKVS